MPTSLKKLALIVMLPILLLAGCMEDDEIGMTSSPILHGKSAHDDQYGAVVALSILEDGKYYPYCSGILIDKKHVLTAAHCISNDEQLPFSTLYQNNQIVITFGEDAENPESNHIFTIDRYYPYAGYDSRIFLHDIGLIVLDKPVSTVIAKPFPYLTNNKKILEIQNNFDTVEFVGFGIDENNHDSKRLVNVGYIDYYCQKGIDKSGACVSITDIGERISVPEKSMMHSLEKGGPCSGDSGGPVLADINGTKQLIGIISAGDGNCRIFTISTSVPDHADWIEEKINPKKKKDGCSVMPQHDDDKLPVLPLYLLLLGAFLIQCIGKRRLN